MLRDEQAKLRAVIVLLEELERQQNETPPDEPDPEIK
jgi:hypothetical protein